MNAAPPIRKAVILSAGKGSRLLPLTADRPKCLLDLSGRTLLDRQIDALEAAGIEEIVVVTGFGEDQVDRTIAARGADGAKIRTLFNPFYHVADNLGSVWMARHHFDRDLLLLNGDTLIPPALVARVIAGACDEITVTIDRKPSYDADDMKVQEAGGRLLHIGKTLTAAQANAESIGMLAFRGEGRAAFIAVVEAAMRTPEGTTSWYLRAIDRLAQSRPVAVCSIEGIEWGEVDFPQDYETAGALAAKWDAASGTVREPRGADGKWTALVLAGERPGGNILTRTFGLAAKALVPIDGEPMIAHVARALLVSPSVGRVVILSQNPDSLRTEATAWLEDERRVRFVRCGDGISDSVGAVAGSEHAPWPVLVTTADHPLLTPAIIEEFLGQTQGADLAVGAVGKETVLRAYPQSKRTWLRFADGAHTGANLFALTSDKVLAALSVYADVEADRKKAFRLFWRFGPFLALRAMTRTISFAHALEAAGRNLGVRARLAVLTHAYAAVDVDKLSDLKLAETILQARRGDKAPGAAAVREEACA